jgi:hypothetical protein
MMDYSAYVDKVTHKKVGEEVGTAELEYKLFRFFWTYENNYCSYNLK